MKSVMFVTTVELRPMLILSVIFSALLLFGLSAYAQAQDDPIDEAPPALTIVPKEEKTQLEAQADVKVRTTLALELMATHIGAAEKLNTEADFDGLFRELGQFEGIVDNQLNFLARGDTDNKHVLYNLKRLEIGLRSFVPRIETIRRDLPVRFEPFVHNVEKFIRKARAKALDPMFGDTVVSEPEKKNR